MKKGAEHPNTARSLGCPRRTPSADNEAGWREALAKLTALVEAG